MGLIRSSLQAIGLFLVTNIDDILVLSLFFARGAGQRGTTTKIVAGQYMGFGGILLASVAVTLGAGFFLPEDAIPHFGLIPLLLGSYAAWQVCRNGDHDDDTLDDKPITALTVAAITFANGGDNIGVFVPVFLAVGTGALVAYSVVFLALVLVLSLPPSSWPLANRSQRCWNAGSTSCSRSSSSCLASSS